MSKPVKMAMEDVGKVCGFSIVRNNHLRPEDCTPTKGPYGVKTGRLRTPGNYWPNVFDCFQTLDDAETWIRTKLIPSGAE